jgi:hypothetical protein
MRHWRKEPSGRQPPITVIAPTEGMLVRRYTPQTRRTPVEDTTPSLQINSQISFRYRSVRRGFNRARRLEFPASQISNIPAFCKFFIFRKFSYLKLFFTFHNHSLLFVNSHIFIVKYVTFVVQILGVFPISS